MEKPVGIKVVGIYLALVSICIGSVCFLLGLSWFLLDAIAILKNNGGNLTGLGIILGFPIAVLGGSVLLGFRIAVGILGRRKKDRIYAIGLLGLLSGLPIIWPWLFVLPLSFLGINMSFATRYAFSALNLLAIIYLLLPKVKENFIAQDTVVIPSRLKIGFVTYAGILAVAALTFAVRGNMRWQKKQEAYHQKQKEWESFYEAQHREILTAFDSRPSVKVQFYLTFADQTEIKRKAGRASLPERNAINKEFVVSNIINTFTADELIQWTISQRSSIVYYVEVTKTGYEKLKASKYAKWIKMVN